MAGLTKGSLFQISNILFKLAFRLTTSRTKGSSSSAASRLPLLKCLEPHFHLPYDSTPYLNITCIYGVPSRYPALWQTLQRYSKMYRECFFFKEILSERTSSKYMKWGMWKESVAMSENEWFKKKSFRLKMQWNFLGLYLFIIMVFILTYFVT